MSDKRKVGKRENYTINPILTNYHKNYAKEFIISCSSAAIDSLYPSFAFLLFHRLSIEFSFFVKRVRGLEGDEREWKHAKTA